MRIRECHIYNAKSIIEDEIFSNFYSINEHPNQAKKILKDKNLDPDTNPQGKEILDRIIKITRADGYTGIFTQFHIVDKLPFDELETLYEYLKTNKQSLKQLPKQIFQYERYADLHRDIEMLEIRRKSGLLVKELPSHLKREVKSLDGAAEQDFFKLGEKFSKLKDGHKQQFIAKISKYKDIYDLMRNLRSFITGIESGEDAETITNKIKNTDGADIILYDKQKNVLIAYIRKYDAANKLGCTSQWCITTSQQQWRNYKRGGNKYFFMWDFNYDPSDSRYMVATAYNEKNPSGSATHVKNDTRVQLPEILNDKNIPIKIFDKFIAKIRADFLANIDNSKEFLSSLKEFVDKTNTENLITVLQQSEIIQEHGKPEDIEEIDYQSIDVGIDKNEWLEIFDINEEDFSYIDGMTGYYGNYNDNEFYDREEYNYMGGFLSSENVAIINDITKLFGFNEKGRKELIEEEGKLYQFFEKYGMEDITQQIGEGYDEANDEARTKLAQNKIDSIPIDIDESSISPSHILNYINDNEIGGVVSFDDFIEKASENIDDFSYESIDEEVYATVDYDNLNNNITSYLIDILNELNDPNSERAQKTKYVIDGIHLLNKLGFEEYDEHKRDFPTPPTNEWYKRLNNGSLLIIKGFQEPFEYEEDSEEYENGLKGIPDEASFDAIVKKGEDYRKRGSIRYSNLANYVNQYEIPYQESVLNLKNIINEEVISLKEEFSGVNYY